MKKKSKLVHPSFPAQGGEQPSYMGSQSMMPSKSPDNYPGPMGPDPGDYQQ